LGVEEAKFNPKWMAGGVKGALKRGCGGLVGDVWSGWLADPGKSKLQVADK
jgi:hypothetical protein